MKLFQLMLISSLFINSIVFFKLNDALSLDRKYIYGKEDDGNWLKVAVANDDENYLTYKTKFNKIGFIQFRIDREDDSLIFNDMYLNITTEIRSKFGIFFNNFVNANLTTDNRHLSGYTPIYFITCGAPTPYFSLSSNNTYNSEITITVTVKDYMKLCDF